MRLNTFEFFGDESNANVSTVAGQEMTLRGSKARPEIWRMLLRGLLVRRGP